MKGEEEWWKEEGGGMGRGMRRGNVAWCAAGVIVIVIVNVEVAGEADLLFGGGKRE